MQFGSYSPVVNRNTIHATHYTLTHDLNAYGGNAAGLGALNAGINQVQKTVNKIQDENDASDLMEAKNKIMTAVTSQMYGEDGLITNGVGVNAKGLQDRVTKAIQDTSHDIMKNYNPRVQQALKANLNENMLNFQRLAAGQEMREKRAVDKANFESTIENNIDLVSRNYADAETLNTAVKDARRTLEAQALKFGLPAEEAVASVRNAITRTVGGAVSAAMANGDNDKAGQILDAYKAQMDAGEYWKLKGSLRKSQDSASMKVKVKDLLAQCRVQNADGTYSYDMRRFSNMIENTTKYINRGGTPTDAVAKGFQSILGVQMDNKRNGCVEAALKGTGSLNAFAQRELQEGVLNVPRLLRDALNPSSGVSVEQTSNAETAKAGDLIIYFAPGDDRTAENAEHVMVADGAGGVFGNSSSADDYTDESGNLVEGGGRVVHRAGSMETEGLEIGYVIHTNTGGENLEEAPLSFEEIEKYKNYGEALAREDISWQRAERNRAEDNLLTAATEAGSYDEAVAMIDESNLPAMEKSKLKRQAAISYNVSTRSSRNGEDTSGISPLKEADTKALQTANTKFRSGYALTPEQHTNLLYAVDKYIASGWMTEEDKQDYDTIMNDEQVMSDFTSDIQDGGVTKAYEHLIQQGASPIVATMVIAKADPYYTVRQKNVDEGDEY